MINNYRKSVEKKSSMVCRYNYINSNTNDTIDAIYYFMKTIL